MLSDIAKADVEDYISWMLDQGRADETTNDALRDIRAVYNHAIDSLEVFTGDNPTGKIKKIKIDRDPPAVLTIEQVDALIDAAREYDAERPTRPKMEWVILLGAHAGMRRNEIANAHWSWFNFDLNKPKAKRKPTINMTSLPGFQLKSKSARTLPMSKWIRESLEAHPDKTGYLFNSIAAKRNGGNIYRYDTTKPYKEVCRRAGLETIEHLGEAIPLKLHTLRATFGSLRVQASANIADVSRWLGHGSIRTTEKHYLHLVQGYNESIDLV